MTLEQLFDAISKTLTHFDAVLIYDGKDHEFIARIMAHSVKQVGDMQLGKTKFIVRDKSATRALGACYSWACAYIMFGKIITEPDQFLVKK